MNCVELRTNVFGSEQKSLRAWRGGEWDVREDDTMGDGGRAITGGKS